ncbi:MAG: site-specific integrase, partial [Candidatus Omnitrophica bacterium]|nr:site-specific integrase [Candidatus Omnitrophota bacterium]
MPRSPDRRASAPSTVLQPQSTQSAVERSIRRARRGNRRSLRPLRVPSAPSAVARFLRYLSTERNASPYTCLNYALDLDQFFQALGHRRVRGVNSLDIRRFVAHLSARQHARRTIARKLSCVRSFFRFLCREGTLEHNPAAAIPTPRLEKRLPSFLDEQQITRLLETPPTKKWQGWRDRA